MCWQLDKPLCGDCAYLLDQKLDKKADKLMKNPIVKKFIKEEIIPILLQFKQQPNFKLYKKTYVRRPSTKGGRFSTKNSSKGIIRNNQENIQS